MLSEPLDVLLAHDHWASRNLFEACRRLSEAQFHRPFEMGRGSLHDTLTHLVGAMRGWCDFLSRREMRPRPEADGKRRSADELLAMLDEAAAELSACARAGPVGEEISAERGGKTYTFTRGGVVTHVTTHSMHHRAQCLNMLRHLRVDPLPQSSVLEWMLGAGGGR